MSSIKLSVPPSRTLTKKACQPRWRSLLLAGLCYAFVSPVLCQPLVTLDDENEELIVKLLEPEEKWCPLMLQDKAFQLELESAFVESIQGIVAAAEYRLDHLFQIPSQRRAWLSRQLKNLDKSIVESMENFQNAGTARLILTPEQKSDEATHGLLLSAAVLYKIRYLCTNEGQRLTSINDAATDTSDWSLRLQFGKSKMSGSHFLGGLQLLQEKSSALPVTVNEAQPASPPANGHGENSP